MTRVILTCSEHFTELAVNEIRRQHPQTTLVEQLSSKHLLLKAPGTFADFVRPWQNHLPIYLHHLFPVHRVLPLSGTTDDFAYLRREARALGQAAVHIHLEGHYPYSVNTLKQALNSSSIDERVISMLIIDHCCYMGIAWKSQNVPVFKVGGEPVPNRAGLKLLEALDTFEIRLRPGDHALDLGAAPGAWTEILRRRGMRVTAVAPDEMYDWLQTDPNVRSFRVTAEEHLASCDTVYDLIVNDMKLDAQDSARLMVQYAAYLREQGIAIMTLKLRMENPRRVIDHALRLLRKAYKIIRMRQLVSNRKEITLFLRRKG